MSSSPGRRRRSSARRSRFDDVWARRRELVYAPGIRIAVPTIDDLIKTKQWALRDKDVADIRLLEAKRLAGDP